MGLKNFLWLQTYRRLIEITLIFIALQALGETSTSKKNLNPSGRLNTQTSESQHPRAFDVTVLVDKRAEQSTPIDVDNIEFIYEDRPGLTEDKNYEPANSENCSDTDSDDNLANVEQLIGTKGGKKQLVCLTLYSGCRLLVYLYIVVNTIRTMFR